MNGKLAPVPTPDELDAALDAGGGSVGLHTGSCMVCACGDRAVAIVARAIERNDAHGLGNYGRISAHRVAMVLANECGYSGSDGPVREHAMKCLRRQTWARP